MNKVAQIFIGVVWLIFGLLILVNIWNWITILGGLIQDSTFTTMYYIGVVLMTLLVIFLPPYMLVITAFKEEE